MFDDLTGEPLVAHRTPWYVAHYDKLTGEPYEVVRVWWTEVEGRRSLLPRPSFVERGSAEEICETCGVPYQAYKKARYAGIESKILLSPRLFFLAQRLKGEPVQEPNKRG